MAMNNKLKFLLSSIIILGGYITASDCYCMEIENNNQVNQNNNYLVKLCKQNKVDVDENGNILENDKFLNDQNYFEKISSNIQNIIDKNLKGKISENTRHNFMVFLRYVDELCNDQHPNVFFTHNVQNTVIPLNQKFPQLIKLDKGYGDNITLNQLQNYLKNKIRLLLINCCNEIINNQTNKDKSELENLVINKARNLYIDVKSILIWLPDFFINTLHIDDQNFALRYSRTITNIVEFAMYLLNKDGNIIAEEDENLMLSYECCFPMSAFREIFSNFLKENSTNISQSTLSILSDINSEVSIQDRINNLGIIINIIGNIQLSRTELNNALPGIITLNTNSKHGDNISLSQFIRYLGNKIELLLIQYRANICKKNEEFNKNKDKKILENIITQETKIFYEKFNKIISWLPEFLRKNDVPEDVLTSYITELDSPIAQLNSIMLITNKDSNGNINIDENNHFMIYENYLERVYLNMRDKCNENFKNINNWFKFHDMYELFNAFVSADYNINSINSLICYGIYELKCNYNTDQLLPDEFKQRFYNLVTLPIDHNNNISVLQALTYLNNKITLLTINCFNEIQQYIKECKNIEEGYGNINNNFKTGRLRKLINYHKQILNILNWLKDFVTEELKTNDAMANGMNESLQMINSCINQLTQLKHSICSFDIDFNQIMNKLEEKRDYILLGIPHDNNNQIIENKEFVTKIFDEDLRKFCNIFTDIYHARKCSSIPRIGEWASEVYNLIREFDHCAQRGLSHINNSIIESCNDYSLLQESLSKTFNREELNNKFKNILNDINQNEKNIIIDNKDFIYVDKNTKPYYISMEKIDPKQINLFQLIQYCGNKIFKEEVNTFSRIINACKNDNDPDHFQQILKDNMLIGCKRINGVICALYTFLENIKNNLLTEVARNETREESINFIKDIVTKEDLLRFMIKRNIVSRENLRSLAPKINVSEEDLLEFINTIEKENSLKFDNSTNKAKLFEFISNISKEELLKRINNISKDDLLKLVQAIHQEYSEDCKYTITTFINNLKDSKRKIDEFIKQFILNGLLDMDI